MLYNLTVWNARYRGGGGGGNVMILFDSTISTLIYQILFIKMNQEGEIRKEQFLAGGEACKAVFFNLLQAQQGEL